MLKSTLTAFALIFVTALASAQDDALIDIDIDKTEWYENPILWVAVAAFFIILIVVTRRKRT